MNLTESLIEWKIKHGVTSFGYTEPESDGYFWIAQKSAADSPLFQGQGSTEFAACYALARKLQVQPPEVENPCADGCQYAKDVGMENQASCSGKCYYMEYHPHFAPPPLTNAAR